MKANKQYTQPVIVLVLICFFVSLALAFTYKVANPVIVANAEAAAIQSRQELLPDADDFTDVSTDNMATSTDGKAQVTEAYEANNGAGYVFTVQTTSFGGALTMMVGVDANGAITGVKISSHSDTAGVGTKNFTDEYLGQYVGLTSINNEDVKKDGQITYISGASVTGTALQKGVYAALAEYAELGGAQ